MHPHAGGLKSGIHRHMGSLSKTFLVSLFLCFLYLQSKRVSDLLRTGQKMTLYDVSYGALTLLWAGTMAEGKNLNGKVLYFYSLEFVFSRT